MECVRRIVLGSLALVITLPAHAAGHDESAKLTVRLVSTDAYSKVLADRAPANEVSKGDVIVVESKLRNAVAQFGRPKGAVVGGTTWVFTIRTPASAHLIVLSRLPGGDLRGAGRVRLGPKQTFSVTGGSGRFANARGTGESVAYMTQQGQGNRRSIVFRLVLR
jgi:hypothetical protein